MEPEERHGACEGGQGRIVDQSELIHGTLVETLDQEQCEWEEEQ